jgi:type I restriction enzyme S subunit
MVAAEASLLADRSGWKKWRFHEIAENVTDRVDDPSRAGVERYVGLEHLDPDSVAIRRWGHPSDVSATKLLFRKGDIIFGRRRAYQRKLGVADCDGVCSAHALVLRARQDVVLPEFLPFFLQSENFFSRALKISVGSLSPTINWRTLARQEFALPPRVGQRGIANLLWKVEHCRNTWRRAGELLRLTRGYWFTAMTSSEDMGRLSEFVDEIVAGRSPKGSNMPADDDDLGVLKVSAIGPSGFEEMENKALISRDDFVSEFEVRPGFILVTRANAKASGVGRACMVEKVRPGLMLSDKTLRLVPRIGVDPLFLLEALHTTAYRRHVEQTASGTEAKNISQARLGRAPVPRADTALQARISGALGLFDLARRTIETHFLRLEDVRNAAIRALVG